MHDKNTSDGLSGNMSNEINSRMEKYSNSPVFTHMNPCQFINYQIKSVNYSIDTERMRASNCALAKPQRKCVFSEEL